MSSEIFYKKAFIKVGDGIIPLANHGSSNCFDLVRGREVAEKGWHVLNHPHREKFIFSVEEMEEQASTYEEINTSNRGGTRKSRNTVFEIGEFGKWILAGVKNAKTIEEYVSYGNRFYVFVYSEKRKLPFQTTEELLKILEEYKGCRDLEISFENNRDFISKRIKGYRRGRHYS